VWREGPHYREILRAFFCSHCIVRTTTGDALKGEAEAEEAAATEGALREPTASKLEQDVEAPQDGAARRPAALELYKRTAQGQPLAPISALGGHTADVPTEGAPLPDGWINISSQGKVRHYVGYAQRFLQVRFSGSGRFTKP